MNYIVNTGESGLTVEEFLQQRIASAPVSYLRQLLKKNKITRNNQALTGSDLLTVGDVVHLPDSARLQELLNTITPGRDELSILFESREILVVEKPSGLAVHSSAGHQTANLTTYVEQMLALRGDRFRTAPVHRLDLGTSGPVMFGKGKQACAALGKLFIRHEVDKHYLALVAGRTKGAGTLRSEILSKGKNKLALAEYRALSRHDRASLLELRPVTGRQHQIRRQLAEVGHPIFGDRRYRGPCPETLDRMFLHCCRLSFIDPFCGAQLEIHSELPQMLRQFAAESFGLEDS